MTNPYQQPPSGHLPPPLPGLGGARRGSYATVASGSGNMSRPIAFAHLLNPVEGADQSGQSSRNQDLDYHLNLDHMATGNRSTGAHFRLPPISSTFEKFVRGISTAEGFGSSESNTTFFVPTYLDDTDYARRLEEQNRISRALSPRDALASAPNLVSNSSTHNHNRGSKAPSAQRAVSQDGADKQPQDQSTDATSTPPLPTRWNKADKEKGLEVMTDGLDVKYVAVRQASRDLDHEASAVRADYHIPPECGIYYYEMTIIAHKRDDTTIGIGVSDKKAALQRPPGWETNSWGYHGDDGLIFHGHPTGKPYGPTFGKGDVIGCGVNFTTDCIFYTKNGVNLGTAFRDVLKNHSDLKLFPVLGLKKTGEHVRVNFGQTPFAFDIDGMVKERRIAIHKQISQISTDSLAPPLNETDLIQQLVLQFLHHDGYVDTARAFAQEVRSQKQALCLDADAPVEDYNVADDEDAKNRQRIRKAVLEGNIDLALKLTDTFYPNVLQENEPVFFRLRCRKYVEIIRRDAELKLLAHGTHSNGDMEVDAMDVEGGTAHAGLGRPDLIHEAISYGRTLQAEYKNDPRIEVQQALQEIFALPAYENPLKQKEVAHLLDRSGRVSVGEELNAAILQSLGKSSRSALENLYAQTSVLLDELREDGGAGALVSIKSVVDEIPRPRPRPF